MSTLNCLAVAKDLGNGLCVRQVAQRLASRNVSATFLLDRHGTASGLGSAQASERGLLSYFVALEKEPSANVVKSADFVMISPSASGSPNIEQDAFNLAVAQGVPVFILEDFPGGRNNPGWDAKQLLTECKRLFAVMRLPGSDNEKVEVVGAWQAELYRNLDIKQCGLRAREKLGIDQAESIVWYSGHPDSANPIVVAHIAQAIARIGTSQRPIVFVVSRHGREIGLGSNDMAAAHRHIMRTIAQNAAGRFRVLENSVGHKELPLDNPFAVLPEFRPPSWVSYQELMCACSVNGIVVTGFGTDGAIVAPALRIPSVQYLDRDNFLLSHLLLKEKHMQVPAFAIWRAEDICSLAGRINDLLFGGPSIQTYRCWCEKDWPSPERNPLDVIADTIVGDLMV